MTEANRWRRLSLLLILGSLASACLVSGQESRQSSELLHPIFRDRAVLQRDRPMEMWGWAAGNAEVEVSFAGVREVVRAESSGRWSATLPPMPEGGPYTLEVRADNGETITAADILIGDVFLCSGQSNMVLQVQRTLNSRAEIAKSTTDTIRQLSVPMATALGPVDRFRLPVEWQVATPETVGEWSATCFYFARELQQVQEVPIGIVVAAWGGSGIRPWMSKSALRALGGYERELELLELFSVDPSTALEEWGRVWETWWWSRTSEKGAVGPWSPQPIEEDAWSAAPTLLDPWEGWGVDDLEEFDGMVWYRTTVRLSEDQAEQSADLSLGKVDEIDQTWVNGHAVGSTSDAGVDRLYHLPATLLRSGENLIVVNVTDTWESGGLYGEPGSRSLHLSRGEKILLDGTWLYQVVPSEVGLPPRAPWGSTGGMTTMFNAMIAPLGAYGFRGAVWYQGESNTGEPGRYEELLTGLIADWRTRFGVELPFLIVQLANYGPPPTAPVESGWAEVREAQRRVASNDPLSGLAVTIDVGDRYDIHPANKQEIGRRLARAARHLIYGESITPSGPVAMRARQVGGDVVVDFADVTVGLLAYGAEEPIGFELCGTEPGSCRFAQARIDGDRVLLRSTLPGAPARVRFCWSDSPVCTLYDGTGLPAGPFEMGVE